MMQLWSNELGMRWLSDQLSMQPWINQSMSWSNQPMMSTWTTHPTMEQKTDGRTQVGERRIWTRANWTYDLGVDEDRPITRPKIHREHFKQVENVVDWIQNKGGPINPLSAQKENKRSLMVRRVIILTAPASQETTAYAPP